MSLSWLNKYNLLIFDEIDSTNSEALRLAKTGLLPDRLIIWAKNQTSGRGRNGRSWFSQTGNLHVSLLLNATSIPIMTRQQLSFVTALVLHKTIESLANEAKINLNLKLKWPNDLLIDGKKIAGILIETISVAKKDYVVIGVGINIKTHPLHIDQLAINLLDVGIISNASQILSIFMRYFTKYYTNWQNAGFTKMRDMWLKKTSHTNTMMILSNQMEQFYGEFQDIDYNGNIRIKLTNGETYTSASDEIISIKKGLEN
jgi:BirA family biotin operon repressor/biotin-[acetyl-CoA-carboxylase] ligase